MPRIHALTVVIESTETVADRELEEMVSDVLAEHLPIRGFVLEVYHDRPSSEVPPRTEKEIA